MAKNRQGAPFNNVKKKLHFFYMEASLTRKRLLQQKVDKTRRSTVETQIKVKDTLKYKQVYTSRVFLCQFYAYLMPKGLLRNMQFFDFMLFFPWGIPNCYIHNNL